MIASARPPAPGDVSRLRSLHPSIRLLWIILLEYEGRVTTHEELAQHIGTSVRTVGRGIAVLVRRGLLKVDRKWRSAVYTCVAPPSNGGGR